MSKKIPRERQIVIKFKEKYLTDVIICGLIAIIIVLSVVALNGNCIYNNPLTKEYRFEIDNSSNSMGLTFDYHNVLTVVDFKQDEFLEYGKIYVYKNNKDMIVHRLVGCADLPFSITNKTTPYGCERTIFKGDNNLISEIVDRSDIKYFVTSVEQIKNK